MTPSLAFALVGAAFFVLCAAAALYEVVALVLKWPLITDHVRWGERRSPALAVALAGFLGWLLGHFGRF